MPPSLTPQLIVDMKRKKKLLNPSDVQLAKGRKRIKKQLSDSASLDHVDADIEVVVPKSRKPLTEKELHYFIINTLRRASYRWPCRYQAFNNARVELPPLPTKDGKPGKKKRIMFRCAECKKLFTRKQVRLDHIVPVVGLEGFRDWNEYVPRLFCPTENFQVICLEHHHIKTQAEQAARREYKKNNKLDK